MNKTIQELEQELRERKYEEAEKKRTEKLRKEEMFREKNKTNVYWSDDYAGLESGDYSFYYGYEKTLCPFHKTERCSCDEQEWCFVAEIKEQEVVRIPSSKLWFENKEVMEMLLLGIGCFLNDNPIGKKEGEI